MNLLFIGDIVGKKGREAVISLLPGLIKKYELDFVIANGENASHGKGLIEHHYQSLIDAGVDCITLGNHYEAKSEIKTYINGATCLIRPANLKKEFPGIGTQIFLQENYSIRVTNLMGMAFMGEEVENSFDVLSKIISSSEPSTIHIVDYHGEATGEKYAVGYSFDGKISALLGTHTHVQTRDARILPNGTGYISDVGMTGPYNGILGVKKEAIISRLWHEEKQKFDLDEGPETLLSAVILTIDEKTGVTTSIVPIYQIIK